MAVGVTPGRNAQETRTASAYAFWVLLNSSYDQNPLRDDAIVFPDHLRIPANASSRLRPMEQRLFSSATAGPQVRVVQSDHVLSTLAVLQVGRHLRYADGKPISPKRHLSESRTPPPREGSHLDPDPKYSDAYTTAALPAATRANTTGRSPTMAGRSGLAVPVRKYTIR
jgi:hypothetical protein